MKSNKVYGNISKETAEFMQALIATLKIKSILEIGSSTGYSSYMFSRFCQDIETIEFSADRIKLFRKYQKKYDNPAKLIEGDALKILPTITRKYDLIFIDGVNADYLKYFRLSLPLLNKDGIIVADNTIEFEDKMKDFFEEIKKYSNITLNIGEGLTIIDL